MHRIECVPCGNRPFNNKEALQQHLKTSSAWHPVCAKCDKRFSSESGLEAHMAAKHPPTFDCLICGRPYKQLFALEDHYRGSPHHPNCPRCGKGFKDVQELEIHRNTAHPKVACVPCGGELVYEDQDSLERHYAASEKHPNCHLCNKGFSDEDSLSEHINSAHSTLPCGDQPFTTLDGLNEHGSSDGHHEIKETMDSAVETSEAAVVSPSAPATISPISRPAPMITPSHHAENGAFLPSSPFLPTTSTPAARPSFLPPSPSSKRSLQQLVTTKNATSSTSVPLYHTGFTPLSPRPNPFKDLSLLGPVRIDSPDLRLQVAYSSPIMNVQFSPTTLLPPGRAADELWNSKENVQVPAAATQNQGSKILSTSQASVWSEDFVRPTEPQLPAAPSISPLTAVGKETQPFRNDMTPLGSTSSSLLSEPFSPSTSSISSHFSSSAGFSPPPRTSALTSFGRTVRLSPPSTNRFGYSRHYASLSTTSLVERPINRSVSPTRSVASTVVQSRPSRMLIQSPQRGSTTTDTSSQPLLPRRLSPPYEFNPRLYPGSARQALRNAGGDTNGSSSSETKYGGIGSWRYRQAVDPIPWQSLIPTAKRSALDSPDSETPRVESPKEELASFTSHRLTASDVSASLSPSPLSMSSNFSADLEMDDAVKTPMPDFDATQSSLDSVAQSSLGLEPPQISFSTSMESSFLRSPEVGSPLDLAKLPAISPLPETPVDLATFDIPEARHPLPESVPPSPGGTVVLLTEEQDNNDTPLAAPEVRSAISSPGSGSWITSPQEPIASSPPAPPFTSISCAENTVLTSESESRDNESDVPQTVATSVTSLPPTLSPLHCRECKLDPCDDITATMCGHIFCNRCIVDAVIKSSRCPLCSTPTLLYCLFRLDLAA